MPRIGRNNSSNEGGNSGKSRSVPSGMKGLKLAKRLPHLSSLIDGTLSASVGRRNRAGKQTNTFASAGTYNWKVPEGVDTLTVTMYGGGGGGGAGDSNRGTGHTGHGGGGGAKVSVTINEIAPKTTISFTVGTGGASGAASAYAGNGGDTTFTYGGVNYVAGGGCGGGPRALIVATGGSGGIGSGSGATIVHGNTGYIGTNGDKTGSGGLALDGGAYGGYGQGGSGAMSGAYVVSAVGVPGAIIVS